MSQKEHRNWKTILPPHPYFFTELQPEAQESFFRSPTSHGRSSERCKRVSEQGLTSRPSQIRSFQGQPFQAGLQINNRTKSFTFMKHKKRPKPKTENW